MEVSGLAYRERFGTRLSDDFREPLAVLQQAGLLTLDADERLRLTTRGMFFADSVAGLLAWPRTRKIRRDLPPFEAEVSMMG